MARTYAAARAGAQTLDEFGRLPNDQSAAVAWVYRKLGIWTDEDPELPVNGIAYASPVPILRGGIVLRTGLAHFRWTLAHEIGHILLGDLAQAHMQLNCDDTWWHRVPVERQADQFACCFLLPLGALLQKFADNWTADQVAAFYGVPRAAVMWRLEISRALREWCPNRQARYEAALLRGV